jgi:hypothetical protein
MRGVDTVDRTRWEDIARGTGVDVCDESVSINSIATADAYLLCLFVG